MDTNLTPLTDFLAEKFQGLQLYKTFFDFSKECLVITSPSGYFIDVNERFCCQTRYSKKVLLETPFIKLVHPEDVQKTIDVYSGKENGLPVVDFQNRYMCGDGVYRLCTWNVATILPDNIYGTVVITDIN